MQVTTLEQMHEVFKDYQAELTVLIETLQATFHEDETQHVLNVIKHKVAEPPYDVDVIITV